MGAQLRNVGPQRRTPPPAPGGEEFALILPGTDAETAQEIAERVRTAIARLSPAGSELTCSAGVAVYPVDADDAGDPPPARRRGALLGEALRQVAGRRRFDPDHVRLSRRRAAALRDRAHPGAPGDRAALPAGRVPHHGPPDRLRGARPLPRRPGSPTVDLVRPGATRAVSGPSSRRPRSAPRSSRSAARRAPTSRSTSAPRRSPPSGLSSALPDDLSDVIDRAHRARGLCRATACSPTRSRSLRERGARIAIDDAGAGYAGLKQVMWVRPDIVKLDLELTRAIHSDPVRMALVESLVRFARRVGATVCAEGIESHDDIEVLANLDVPWGQGYAIGRPAPPWSPGRADRRRDLPGGARQGACLEPGRRDSDDLRRRPPPRAPQRPARQRTLADGPLQPPWT